MNIKEQAIDMLQGEVEVDATLAACISNVLEAMTVSSCRELLSQVMQHMIIDGGADNVEDIHFFQALAADSSTNTFENKLKRAAGHAFAAEAVFGLLPGPGHTADDESIQLVTSASRGHSGTCDPSRFF